MRVVDLASQKVLHSLTRPGRFCQAAFDPEGKRVAIGGYGPVKVWNLETGKPEGRFSTRQAHTPGGWEYLVFSPDGKYVASGGNSGEIKFWESATGRLLFVIEGCGGDVEGVAFSPDGKRLAACAVTRSTSTFGTWRSCSSKFPTSPRRSSHPRAHGLRLVGGRYTRRQDGGIRKLGRDHLPLGRTVRKVEGGTPRPYRSNQLHGV